MEIKEAHRVAEERVSSSEPGRERASERDRALGRGRRERRPLIIRRGRPGLANLNNVSLRQMLKLNV